MKRRICKEIINAKCMLTRTNYRCRMMKIYKPLIKSSRYYDYNFRELRMVKCSIITFTEWTYEGNPKVIVGVDGFPNRYFGADMIVSVIC
ncbi:MAG TPA: hypothetical protein DC000_10430 [Clostridiales bacterium]|nr:hypothetical protein [Clostridiales bacterium]